MRPSISWCNWFIFCMSFLYSVGSTNVLPPKIFFIYSHNAFLWPSVSHEAEGFVKSPINLLVSKVKTFMPNVITGSPCLSHLSARGRKCGDQSCQLLVRKRVHVLNKSTSMPLSHDLMHGWFDHFLLFSVALKLGVPKSDPRPDLLTPTLIGPEFDFHNPTHSINGLAVKRT